MNFTWEDGFEDYSNFTVPKANVTEMFNSTIIPSSRDPLSLLLPMTIFYVIILIAGVLGNVITCIVISKNKLMHTATNYYLFNLAVSDLSLLLAGVPMEFIHIWLPSAYPFSQRFCVLQGLLQETSTNATVLTITSFTVERYIAICHPFRQHTMSKLSRAVKFILAIWIVAFCLAVPQALQFGIKVSENETQRVCTVTNAFINHAFEVSGFIFFVGPMTLITVLYVLIGVKLRKSKLLQCSKPVESRHRSVTGQTRVIRMLVAVAVAFFLCWAPFHAQRLTAMYGRTLKDQIPAPTLFLTIYNVLNHVSGIMYYLSTCINPLLYNIMSHKFRDAFKSTISRQCGLGPEFPKNNHTYSALSKGSLRLTATMENHQRNHTHIDILKHETLRNSQKFTASRNPPVRCISISSQSTIFTTISRPDDIRHQNNNGNGPCVNNSEPCCAKKQEIVSVDANPQTAIPPRTIPNTPLSTIAEKLRRGTKSVFIFKKTATAAIGGENLFSKRIKMCPATSADSIQTNTINNSSLQEVDGDELTSTELAQFMADVNNEIC